MKIAFLLMRFNPHGGYERQAFLLARSLVRRGWEVTLFCAKPPPEAPEGLRFIRVPMISGTSWLKVWSYARASARVLALHREEFDHILGFDRGEGMDIYRASNACHKEWLRIRRGVGGFMDGVSVAINPLHRVINAVEGRIFWRMSQADGRIIVLSRGGMAQIQRHYPISAGRFSVIPPAVALERFAGQTGEAQRRRAREALGIGPRERVLLHVGSGFRIKRVESVIRAVLLLRERGLAVRFFIVGRDRKESKRLGRLIKRLGLERQVHLTGPTEAVGGYYAAADLLVMLSLLDTFGVAVAEGLFFGLPAVVGSGAGAADLVAPDGVGDDDLGRVVDPMLATEALAGHIEGLLQREAEADDEALREKRRRKRRLAAEVCNLESVTDAYMAQFATASGGRRVHG